MGGIGYITGNRVDIARNNVLINAHMLEAAYRNGVQRHFYSSSACIYPLYKQHDPDVTPLKEEDAYPADPEEGYGWEKLYSEKLCQYYQEEGKLETRVARFHNIYGPLGTYEGGREKAPAAISRKVALANDGDDIEIWGDGQQTRSFTYVDDCVEGIYRIAQSDHWEPLNLGLRPARHDRPARRSRERGGRQDAREAARPDEAAGRARPQQRQRPLQGGARLGSRGHARGRPEVHLRVDRGPARVGGPPARAGRRAPDASCTTEGRGAPDGGPSCIRSRSGRARERRRQAPTTLPRISPFGNASVCTLT